MVVTFGFLGNWQIRHDFTRFYTLGKLAITEPSQIYNLDLKRQIAMKETGEYVHPEHVPFNHPPMFILLIMPFAYLPIKEAWAAWGIVNFAFALGGLWLLCKSNLPESRIPLILTVLLVATIGNFAGACAVALGNYSGIMLGLTCLTFWALQKRRDLVLGTLLALSSIKFQYLPFLLMPALVQRRYKALMAFAIALLLFLGATAMLLGLDSILNYPHTAVDVETSAYEMRAAQKMPNVRGLLACFFPEHCLFLSLPFTVLGLLLTAKVWLDEKKANSQLFPWAVAITITCMLLTAPHVHMYDFILLTIAAFYTLPSLNSFQSQAFQFYEGRLWLTFLVLLPGFSWFILAIDYNYLHLFASSFNFSVLTTRSISAIVAFLLILAVRCFYKILSDSTERETAHI